jgi:hypothetical protein
MKKNKNMSRYFVTVLGEFDENTIREMGVVLSTMVSKHNLKFQYNNYSAIFHFESEETLEDLYSYCLLSFGEISDAIFVSPLENTGFYMHGTMMNHLLDVKTADVNSNMIIDIEKEINGENNPVHDLMQQEDEEDDDIMTKIRKRIPAFTLDDVLDKICEFGMDSLTEKEKKLLYKHSN